MSPPLAYFLTWTCYGQRLHGDERGSVDRDHNQRGEPFLPPDPARVRQEKSLMSGPPVTLTPTMRAVVHRSIAEACTHYGWHLITMRALTTHVHVICNCRQRVSPERAMAALKARATRDVRTACLAPGTTLWTEHGSTRWINHAPGFYAAICYVNDWQTGVNRELLEERKAILRARLKAAKAWIDAHGQHTRSHRQI